MSAGGDYSHQYSNSAFAGGFLRTFEFWEPGLTSVDDWQTPIRGITGYQSSSQGWFNWAVRTGNFVPGGVYAATLANNNGPSPSTWFKLADDVIVLPVIVISRIAGSAWGPESEQDYRTRALALFDFIPFQGSRTSNWPADWNPPSSHPWSKTAAADPVGRLDPPDDIWERCGIQFQVIRAFKLPQPAPPDKPCAAGNPQLNSKEAISKEILALVGPSEHSLIFESLQPIVVSFGFPDCGNWFGQWTHATVEIDLADSFPPRTVVAHELGHELLGAGHDVPGNLMSADLSGSTLRSDQCEAARSAARRLSALFRDYNEKIGRIRPENPYTPPYAYYEDPSHISWANTCCDLGGSRGWTSASDCFISGGEVLPDAKCTECCEISSSPPDAAFRPFGECPAPQVLSADKCDTDCCKLDVRVGPQHVKKSRLACDGLGGEVVPAGLCARPR
ncbi:MAG: hypothetical protein HYZ29_17780 [Myxococcales bacterium]|nr:hypothetical protein [Myxococcales bacterium]